jgi:ketosteroid isomerase-like protein
MATTEIVRTPLEGGKHPRRTWQEKLLIRDPDRARRALSLVLRQPASSPIRRRVLRDAMEQSYDALCRKDAESIVARLDPSVEVHTDQGGRGGFPDLDEMYSGHGEIHSMIQRWLDMWEEIDWQPVELLDTRDRFVVLSHLRVKSRDGLELDADMGTIYDLRDGWIVRQATYWEWARTLELAGFDCPVLVPA